MVKNRFYLIITAAMAFLAVTIPFFYFLKAPYFRYMMWADRDLYRAFHLPEVFQIYGAEYSGELGARTIGGAYYYLTYLFLEISTDPLFVYSGLLALFLALVALYAYVMARLTDPLTGLILFLVLASSTTIDQMVWELWNPLVAITVAMLAFIINLANVGYRNRFLFFLSSTIIFLATQAHVVYLAVFICSLASAFIQRGRSAWTLLPIGLLAFIVAYAPWLVHQIQAIPGTEVPLILPYPEVAKAARPLMNSMREFIKGLNAFFSFADLVKLNIDIKMVGLPPLFALALGLVAIKMPPKAWSDTAVDWKRHVFIEMYTQVILGVLVIYSFTFSGTFVRPRYLAFVLPSAATLSALGLSSILHHGINALGGGAARRLVAGIVAIASIFGALGLRTTLFDYSAYRTVRTEGGHGQMGLLAYRNRQTVLNKIHVEFGIGTDAILRNVAIVKNSRNKWTSDSLPSHYLLKRENFQDRPDAYSGCIVVVSLNSYIPGKLFPLEKGIAEARQLLAGGHEFKVERVKIDPPYAMVGYRMDDGGCPGSLDNGYVITEEELALEAAFPLNSGREIRGYINAGEMEILVHHPVPMTNYPFNMKVRLTNVVGEVQGHLISKRLRSRAKVTGFLEPFCLRNPEVVFRSVATGKETQLVIARRDLCGSGSIDAPWLSRPISLEKGVYEVGFRSPRLARNNGQGASMDLTVSKQVLFDPGVGFTFADDAR